MATDTFKNRILSLQSNLLNFAFALTSNRDDAYDLLQDTTLKALTHEEYYVEGTNIRGWLFTIMRNIFINNYRRTTRSGIFTDDSDDLYKIDVAKEEDELSPDGTFAVHEIMERLETYSETLRVPFKLYLQGYHYNEIAKAMNLPVGTIKSRIFLARRRLRGDFDSYREDM